MDKLTAAMTLGVAEYTITGLEYDADAQAWVATVRDMSNHTEAQRVVAGDPPAPADQLVEVDPDEEDAGPHGEALAEIAVEMAELAKVLAKSVPEIVEWVADDLDRAAAVQRVEMGREKPRKTLVDAMQAKLDAAVKAAAEQ